MTPPKDETKAKKEKRPNLKRRQYDDAALEAAFGDIIERGMSIRAAAGKHGIPEATIRHKLSGKRALESKPGPKPLLTMTEEQLLVNNIMSAQKASYPVTKSSVMTAVKCILEEEAAKGIERKRPPSFTGDKPGQKWWTLFRKRHPNLNFCTPETPDYSELNIPYTQLEHSSTLYQGVDLGGFKEVSVQTQPPPQTSRASQTESILNVAARHQRLRRLKYDRSLCDMVLDYAGYAPLLDVYLNKPFTVEVPTKESMQTTPDRPSTTPELRLPQDGLRCSEGEDEGRCSREDTARCSWEDKPKCSREEGEQWHSDAKRPKYSEHKEEPKYPGEEDRSKCSEARLSAASVQVYKADVATHF